MCTNVYQNRLRFVEDMTKHFGVFSVQSVVAKTVHQSHEHTLVYIRNIRKDFIKRIVAVNKTIFQCSYYRTHNAQLKYAHEIHNQ